MMQGYQGYLYNNFNFGPFVWIAPFVLLDLVLKGMALWKAARANQLYWFVPLLLVNSFGILPGIYLLFFQKKTKKA